MKEILFLSPIFKYRIWGKDKLKTYYPMIQDDNIGEAWIISAHDNGPSTILNGIYKGQTLNDVYKANKTLFGNLNADYFPLLVKMIDAHDRLSVQVHPDDDMASKFNSYGKNLSGETHKAGGMGYKEGDLGSSYDLGINALRAISRALDHRHEDTFFTDELKKHLDIKTMSDLQNVTEKWYTERTKVASLAPFVTKHANLGNPYAQNICNNAVYELSIAVKSVQTTLKLENPILVIVGSLGNVDGYFKSSLHKLLNEMIPTIKITEPKIDPAYAAAQLALIQSHK